MAKTRRGFQAFADDNELCVGPCTNVELIAGKVEFTYSYAWNAVAIIGYFVGRRRQDDRVSGAWKEVAQTSIDGRRSWKGTADLHVIEANGTTTLAGFWKMGGSTSAAG